MRRMRVLLCMPRLQTTPLRLWLARTTRMGTVENNVVEPHFAAGAPAPLTLVHRNVEHTYVVWTDEKIQLEYMHLWINCRKFRNCKNFKNLSCNLCNFSISTLAVVLVHSHFESHACIPGQLPGILKVRKIDQVQLPHASRNDITLAHQMAGAASIRDCELLLGQQPVPSASRVSGTPPHGKELFENEEINHRLARSTALKLLLIYSNCRRLSGRIIAANIGPIFSAAIMKSLG